MYSPTISRNFLQPERKGLSTDLNVSLRMRPAARTPAEQCAPPSRSSIRTPAPSTACSTASPPAAASPECALTTRSTSSSETLRFRRQGAAARPATPRSPRARNRLLHLPTVARVRAQHARHGLSRSCRWRSAARSVLAGPALAPSCCARSQRCNSLRCSRESFCERSLVWWFAMACLLSTADPTTSPIY